MKNRAAISLTTLLMILSLTGCESKSTTVSVQSVAMLCGFGSTIQSQHFAGIVTNGLEQSVTKENDRKVAVVHVKEGDYVKAGSKLFTYDAESAKNALEKAELELEEQRNSLTAKETEKAQLEKDKEKAASADQLDYTLKIQEMATDIREANYNIALKEKEIKKLEESTKDLDVFAPITGMVVKAGTADAPGSANNYSDDEIDYSSYGSDSADSNAFIKIVETDNYRIKGTINEANVNDIYTGMEMKIYSRLDPEETWIGSISEINLKAAESNQNNDYYYSYNTSDEMTTSSKYAFYISLESLDGLIVGQHVYMTEYDGEYDENEEIHLDASFINDAETSPWVWAESTEGTLEKRAVKIEDYSEYDNTWLITEGLDADDYVAPVSEKCTEGATCIENNNSAFESNGDVDDDGEDFYDEFNDGDEMDDEFDDEEFEDDGWDDEFLDDEFDGGVVG